MYCFDIVAEIKRSNTIYLITVEDLQTDFTTVTLCDFDYLWKIIL